MTATGNLPLRLHLSHRLGQLYLGLVAYGLSMALMVESRLGLDPWDVFHQGVSRHTGLTIGTVSILVGALVLLLWIPLRQRPGIGTVSNVIVIGLAMDASLFLLPTPSVLAVRITFMIIGIVGNGLATGLYIGANLGPGPRDGLMTGYAARSGRSIRLVRTVIEVIVVTVGFVLGGTVGVGTVLYALAIGPLAHLFIPLFNAHRTADRPRRRVRPGRPGRRAGPPGCGPARRASREWR